MGEPPPRFKPFQKNRIATLDFIIFYLPTHHIFGVKYINFTGIFGEKLLLFDRPKLFYLFNFIFISSPRLIKFQNFPVNQLIKKCWPYVENVLIITIT